MGPCSDPASSSLLKKIRLIRSDTLEYVAEWNRVLRVKIAKVKLHGHSFWYEDHKLTTYSYS